MAANNLSNAIEMAKAGFPIISNQLEFLELGNEPQAYPGVNRAASYSPQDYISEFTQWSSAVNTALGLKQNDPIYQAINLGSPGPSNVPATPGPWYPVAMFKDGLSNVAAKLGSISMHYYQTTSDFSVPATQQLQRMSYSSCARTSSYSLTHTRQVT